MAITWNLLECRLGNDDNLTISIQEIVDEIEGKIFSTRVHKDHPKSVFLDALKKQIKADRARKTVESIVEKTIDLSNFETFINS